MEKNYKINHDIPNLTGVKPKIDTGLKKTNPIQKENINEELNKKYKELQKNNNDKLKEYREVLLKLKQEKRNMKK
jgi:hypothetical protein